MGNELGSNITDEEKVIVGENYYLRALSYFLLVNEFAQPYSNNPTQNPGLPLKLTSDPDDLPQSRSTVAEIYDQVVKDLQDAITYMTLPAGMSPKTVAMPPRKLLRLCWPEYICIWKIGKVPGTWRMPSLPPAVSNCCRVKNMQSIPSMFRKKILKRFCRSPYKIEG